MPTRPLPRVAAASVVAIFIAAPLAHAQRTAADSLAEATIEATCASCHPQFVVTQARRFPQEWDVVMARMVVAGARATDEQLKLIRRYLVRYYGRIAVNSAGAQEFSAVLGYTPTAAAAIVAYRRRHGSFANIGALAKVPGINRMRLDQQVEALQFDNPGRERTK